jgi:hypothetical protein
MAILMVEIEVPNYEYEELREEVIIKKKKGFEADCWYSEEDGNKVLVDETYLSRSLCDDSFYVFKLIGVKP